VEELLSVLTEAGFEDLRTGCLIDVFSGSAHESDAKDFETRGLAFSARKPQR
jgi:hypothetical protein